MAPIKSGFALEDPSDPRYQAVAGLRKRVGAFLHDAALSLRDKGDENAVPPVLMLVCTEDSGTKNRALKNYLVVDQYMSSVFARIRGLSVCQRANICHCLHS